MYGDFHYQEKNVVRPSYLNNGNSYRRETASLYWDPPSPESWQNIHVAVYGGTGAYDNYNPDAPGDNQVGNMTAIGFHWVYVNGGDYIHSTGRGDVSTMF